MNTAKQLVLWLTLSVVRFKRHTRLDSNSQAYYSLDKGNYRYKNLIISTLQGLNHFGEIPSWWRRAFSAPFVLFCFVLFCFVLFEREQPTRSVQRLERASSQNSKTFARPSFARQTQARRPKVRLVCSLMGAISNIVSSSKRSFEGKCFQKSWGKRIRF